MPDPDSRQLHGAQIAYRIRAELVCCSLYDRLNANGRTPTEEEMRAVDSGMHSLCYWGDAAARIAEDPTAWQDDPAEGCSVGAPPTVPYYLTPGAPRPDDPDWCSPEDTSYDQYQEQQ